MQITIYGGTGSLGAYFAYKLVKVQHNVTIIGRNNSQNLKQIAEIGLTVKFNNETVFMPSSSFAYIGAYNYSALSIKQDLVIVSLKQPDFDINIAHQIISITDSHSIVGIISNGLPFYFLADFNLSSKAHIEAVDPTGEILQLMQTRKVMTIMPLMASSIESPGVIKVVNPQDKIKTFIGGKFGNYTQLELISTTLNDALIPNNISLNINNNILEKLQFSLAVNVMSALLDQFNGQVFKSEANQNYTRYVIAFVNNLAKALGINNLRDYDKFKALNISESRYSSMHEDLVNGKMPEVKVILSAPLELAYHFKVNISTKPLELLETMILAKSNNISVPQEQIQELYKEAELAFSYNEIIISTIGEQANL